jgi:putative dehydrogenase
LDILVKDLGYVLEMAKSINLPLVLSSLAREIYQMASNLGYGKEDDSAVVKAVETMAGIEKRG